jgi:hypothetical protein
MTKGESMRKVVSMRAVLATAGVVCLAFATCRAQELAPPLPIPIILGTPIVVPESLLLHEVQSMSVQSCQGIAEADRSRIPAPTLQDLLGAKVKEIDIVRVTPNPSSMPSVTGTFTPPAVTAIKRALRRRISTSDCAQHPLATASGQIPFSGAVQADIQFEDGIKRKLITDGSSVAVQDRTGRTWFLRLV